MDWFSGLSVLSLETRRGAEMATLIEKYQGRPTVAPSLREDRQDTSLRLRDFAARVKAAPDRQLLVCMTGIGTRLFLQDLQRSDAEAFSRLKALRILSRGAKPTQALKQFGLQADTVPRPHTWREVHDHLLSGSLRGLDITILEYGEPAPPALVASLAEAGAAVSPVAVYRCAFPDNPEPLRQAVRDTVAGRHQVLLFSSGTQAVHFLRCARDLGLEAELRHALGRMVVASIGPACSEALGELRLPFDLEANPHKMGILVRAAAEHASGLLARKRPAVA
ncbi:uroporphyrinogen-III synthase [Deinococcus sonorensis]|uniref:Uroporphyrinogen-III synthase n=2 Tax=Deinococcus sonorensis TaxID=309891 RepID=A0AAU7U609_9DEIO